MIVDRRALLVGVQDYTRLPPLQGPERDCQLMGRALDKAGWASIQRVPLFALDSGRLLARLRSFLRSLEPTTGALVYFSGHGLSDKEGLRLMPADGESSEDGIPVSEILKMVDNVGYLLLLLECCHAGDIRAGSLDAITGSVGILCATSRTAQARSEDGEGLLARHFKEVIQYGVECDALDVLRKVKRRLNNAHQPAVLYVKEGPSGFDLSRRQVEASRDHDTNASGQTTRASEGSAGDAPRQEVDGLRTMTDAGAGCSSTDDGILIGRHSIPETVVVWRNSIVDVLNDLRAISADITEPSAKRYLASHRAQAGHDYLRIEDHHIIASPSLLDSTNSRRVSRLDPRTSGVRYWKYRLRRPPGCSTDGLDHIYVRAMPDGFSVEFDNAGGRNSTSALELVRYVFGSTLHPAQGETP